MASSRGHAEGQVYA